MMAMTIVIEDLEDELLLDERRRCDLRRLTSMTTTMTLTTIEDDETTSWRDEVDDD